VEEGGDKAELVNVGTRKAVGELIDEVELADALYVSIDIWTKDDDKSTRNGKEDASKDNTIDIEDIVGDSADIWLEDGGKSTEVEVDEEEDEVELVNGESIGMVGVSSRPGKINKLELSVALEASIAI
jgi:hypothetical protein